MQPLTIAFGRKAAEAPVGPAAPGECLAELDRALELDASDVTVWAGSQPWYRTAQGCEKAGEATTEEGWAALLKNALPKADLEGDEQQLGAFEYRENRWRVAYYKSTKGPVLEMRRIRMRRRDPKEYGIPEKFFEVLNKRRIGGLLLVTGPTGTGKSTTLAAALDYLNELFELKIQTLEDPIENVLSDGKSSIFQNEHRRHFRDWPKAIEDLMRRDPDVIVIGEMRTVEAVQAAITAAETGHFVMATLHTKTAAGAVTRLTDTLQGQPDLLSKLASSFLGVLAQQLVRADGPKGDKKLVAAYEFLGRTHAVVNVIREGRTELLAHEIATGKRTGMVMMDDSLARLVEEKRVLAATACDHAFDRAALEKKLGIAPGTPRGANGESP